MKPSSFLPIQASLLRQTSILLLFLGVTSFCFGQDSTLLNLNTQRLQINKTAMYVLGSWAVGNIALGGILRSQTEGSTRYFHEMNAIWNVVNLGIAGASLYGVFRSDPASYDLWATFEEQQKIEKILLFNTALDLGYMTAGAYLMERSRRGTGNPDRLKGYGQSLLLQGGFLFAFDLTVYLIHHSHATPQLKNLLSQIQVGPGGVGVIFSF